MEKEDVQEDVQEDTLCQVKSSCEVLKELL